MGLCRTRMNGTLAAVAVVALLLGATAPPARAQGAQPLSLRMSVTATQADPLFAAAQKFAKLVDERTSGRVKIAPFPGTELGGERDQLEAVKLGTTQVAAVGLNGSNKFLAMFLPYVFRDMEHQGKVIDSPIAQPWKDEILKQQGLHFFGHAYQNPRHLTTANRAVHVPADVKGLKIRVPELPALLETWKGLGANPTPIPVTEIFMALKQGTVEAQENPIEQIINNSFYEVQKYLILLGYSRPVISVMMNDRAWQQLTPAERQIAANAWAEVRDEHAAAIRADEQKRIAFVKSKGVIVIEPDVAAFREATRDVARRLAQATWGAGVYERVVELK